MGVSVVLPAPVVAVGGILRDEALADLPDIAGEARLILDGRDPGCGARDEDRHHPCFKAAFLDRPGNLGGDIEDVGATLSLDLKGIGIDRHGGLL